MAFNDTFIPKPPENVPLPLLSKGMTRRYPSTVLPEGYVFLSSNWNAAERGPTRRAGSIRFAGGAVVTYAPVRDTVTRFITNGSLCTRILARRFL